LILSYAGAQKTWGLQELYCDKEAILGKSGKYCPQVLLDMKKHIKAESMYNTRLLSLAYTSLIDFTMVKKPWWNSSNCVLQCRLYFYAEIDRNLLFKGVTAIARLNMNATYIK
jgi:hypothetical protein